MLYKKLEEDELDIILGASMMEPDIRIQTNEKGFCRRHYRRMLRRKRMLGIGLITESHLAEVRNKLTARAPLGDPSKPAREALRRLNEDCYLCERIDKNLAAMERTAVYLYESDPAFPARLRRAPYFCLPHYTALLDYAALKMNKKVYRAFYEDLLAIDSAYLEELSGDVSWFCKKFDYRYDEEPWYRSKDSVARAVAFLDGDAEED